MLNSYGRMTNSMLANKVQPWTEMPLWIPEEFALEGAEEPWEGSSFISIANAIAAGLSFRQLKDTISTFINV